MLELIDKGSCSDAHPTPLLFVHGAWHAAWCWDENLLDFFADKGFRAVAVSLRGPCRRRYEAERKSVLRGYCRVGRMRKENWAAVAVSGFATRRAYAALPNTRESEGSTRIPSAAARRITSAQRPSSATTGPMPLRHVLAVVWSRSCW